MNLKIFLDIKKALHTVDHAILVRKLQAYWIRGTTGHWFESYLKTENNSVLSMDKNLK